MATIHGVSPRRFDRHATPMVSLMPVKAMAQTLDSGHPFRILILGEPDEMPRDEYATKVVGWFRLIANSVDSTRLDGR